VFLDHLKELLPFPMWKRSSMSKKERKFLKKCGAYVQATNT
jgi:hypothetical protein